MDKKYGWFNVEIIATNISAIFVFHQNKHFPWSLSLGLEVPRGDRFRARRRPRDLLLSILFLRSRTRPFSFFLSRESSWKTIIGHPTRENNNKRWLDSLCKFFDGTSSQNDRGFSIVTFIRLKFHRPSKFLAMRIITWARSSNDNNLFPLGQQKNWNHGSFLSARPRLSPREREKERRVLLIRGEEAIRCFWSAEKCRETWSGMQARFPAWKRFTSKFRIVDYSARCCI